MFKREVGLTAHSDENDRLIRLKATARSTDYDRWAQSERSDAFPS